MAAAPKFLGKLAYVNPTLRTKTDAHLAGTGLFKEKSHFHPVDHARVLDKPFRFVGACAFFADHLLRQGNPSDAAVSTPLQRLQDAPRSEEHTSELQSRQN